MAEDRVAVERKRAPNELAIRITAAVDPQLRREAIDGDEVAVGVDVEPAVVGVPDTGPDLARARAMLEIDHTSHAGAVSPQVPAVAVFSEGNAGNFVDAWVLQEFVTATGKRADRDAAGA